ncbi:MAG: molecular chaperone HtpG [Candidatus Hydrogenedentes bacterium]|nr:molecular chaperone HtpG [Candidatus Hydrogenedentota bacterium]
MPETVETFEFQTEARQLLDLMIHSVYSNKDIFLRELISNCSDALDKRRFEAIRNPQHLPHGTELHIYLQADQEHRTLMVADNGIGMTHDEVRDLIGTIAKSGTREFLRHVQESKTEGAGTSPELIGQFGVGFYSSFMVADKVTLVTRKVGEDTATRWESTGDGTYTLQPADREGPGTTVTLHLKQEEDEHFDEYLDEWKIRSIVKQYSDFVAYPIRMHVERTEGTGEEAKAEQRLETLNSMKALWLRDRSEVTEEEYNEFYKHISHDWNDPLSRIQAKIEGTLEYRLLLYLPSKAPFDLFYPSAARHGVHLYVKRVFIMDNCTELLPDYLRFVRGLVDSEDLSLNISRELLQQNRQIQRMGKGIVSKVLAHLKDLRDKEEVKYGGFWSEFGRVMKEGIFQDHENKESILDLALFASTSGPERTSLQAYLDRMKPDQDAIYFLCGENRKVIENSPHLEAFRDKGYEVLLLDDPVDEVWTSSVFEFKGKKFQSAGKGAVDLGTEEEKKQAEEARKEKEQTHASLLEFLKEQLKEQVKEVRLSSRLTTSAACLVADQHDLSPQLEQIMKAMGQVVPQTKRILEINPAHPVLQKLQGIYDLDKAAPELPDYAQVLYGQALLAEGGSLPDPAHFSKLVTELLVKAL